MLKIVAKHGLERVATTQRGPVQADTSRRPIPAVQQRELPTAKLHREAVADLQYDVPARVWMKPACDVPSEHREPGPSAVPCSEGGQTYDVFAGRVRLWVVSAHNSDLAWDEVERLCRVSGYDAAGVVLKLQTAEVVATPVAKRVRVLTNAEVRARLGVG